MTLLNEELKQEYQKCETHYLNWVFAEACAYGHLDVVKYLLTSPDLKENVDIHYDNELGFRWACEYGRLDIVRYLLTSSELIEHADIHAENDVGFQMACSRGDLEMVTYLLTSSDLTEHANIHANDDYGFRWACYMNHIAISHYLLSQTDDIAFQEKSCNIQWAMENQHELLVESMIRILYRKNIDIFYNCIHEVLNFFFERNTAKYLLLMSDFNIKKEQNNTFQETVLLL